MNHLSALLRSSLATLALATLALAGCSDSTSPDNGGNNNGNNNTNPTIAPKQGSNYTYGYQAQDEDRNPTGSQTSRSDSIVATNLTVAGKSNVYAVYDGTDTLYHRYETNGDISVNVVTNLFRFATSDWSDFPIASPWITIPFVSKTAKSDTLVNMQNYDAGSGIKVPLVVSSSSEHKGTETVTVNGESLTAQKVETVIRVQIASSLHRVTASWSFVPKIGYFSKVDLLVEPSFFSSSVRRGGYVKTMTAYSLK